VGGSQKLLLTTKESIVSGDHPVQKNYKCSVSALDSLKISFTLYLIKLLSIIFLYTLQDIKIK